MTERGVATEEPAARGSLTLSAQAVEHLVVQLALAVDGVAPSGSTFDRVVGQMYPHAAATVAGNRVRVRVEIAVSWPHALAEVTAQVRDTVRAQLHEMAGLEVDAVDVTAAKVVRIDQRPLRRVQ